MNLNEIPDHIQQEGECWVWVGGHDGRGYATIRLDGRGRKVHVLTYEVFRGPVPAGKELHHKCQNKGCVKPSHLQPVTRSEHLQITADLKGRVTHCSKGHELTSGNTYTWKNGRGRTCKQCNLIYTRKRRGVPLEAPPSYDHHCKCGLAWRSTTQRPKRCRVCGAYLYGKHSGEGL